MNYDTLPCRHIGISGQQEKEMLKAIGVGSMDELIDKVMPHNIRLKKDLDLAPAMTEREFAEHMMKLAYKNKIYKSYIGLGWYDTATPAVIQRNIFENPVGVVHILHPISGRNIARPSGSPSQFPDNGFRPYGNAVGQLLAAR